MAGFVFISYSMQDRAYVDRLAGYLAGAGIEVWYDSELLTGEVFGSEISRHIENASAVIVVLSNAAARSRWVTREIAYADSRGKPILPLRLEPGQTPLPLMNLLHWDATGGRMPGEQFLARLRLEIEIAPVEASRPKLVQWESIVDPGPTSVFICYRRKDSMYAAHWLRDHLVGRYEETGKLPKGSIFIDLDRIAIGSNVDRTIEAALRKSRVLIALIGSDWLTMRDGRGNRRLDNPADQVRKEIEMALRLGVWVIPVLLNDASLPEDHDLPASLLGVKANNAAYLRPETFRTDTDRMCDSFELALDVTDYHGVGHEVRS